MVLDRTRTEAAERKTALGRYVMRTSAIARNRGETKYLPALPCSICCSEVGCNLPGEGPEKAR